MTGGGFATYFLQRAKSLISLRNLAPLAAAASADLSEP
jgi:hypothetical protein